MDSKELVISSKGMMIVSSGNRDSNKQDPRRKKRKLKLNLQQTLLILIINSTQKRKRVTKSFNLNMTNRSIKTQKSLIKLNRLKWR